jgi:hypothetical protein
MSASGGDDMARNLTPRIVFTDRYLKSLKPAPAGKRLVHWDSARPSFGVRITDRGVVSFFVIRRMPGKTQPVRVSLGHYPTISLAAARKLATAAIGDLVAGVHPREQFERRDGDLVCKRSGSITTKFLSFIKRDIEPTCYLYRHFDPNGELLYVGISLHALNRQNRHFEKAGWRKSICQIVIEPFETREEALAAEELAIRSEFPKFNSVHNKRRHPYQELARVAVASFLTRTNRRRLNMMQIRRFNMTHASKRS